MLLQHAEGYIMPGVVLLIFDSVFLMNGADG
jgi:hypothetical protein